MSASETPPSLVDLVDDFALFGLTCCTVADRRGIERPFVENPMQRRVNEIEDQMRRETGHAWLYQLKMRRGGLSLNTQLRNLWRTWRQPNTRGITLAHDAESTRELFQITRLAIQRFPPALLPPMSRERILAVTFPEMGSRFFTGTAGSAGLGRGADLAFLHVSEYAFVRDPAALHTSASQAVRADGTYVRETTASSYNSPPHVEWQEARAGRSKTRAVFFGWWWRDDAHLPVPAPDALEPLDDEERQLLPTLRAHQAELRRWYWRVAPDPRAEVRRAMEQLAWRRDKIREIGKTDFDREYPKDETTCWLLAGTPYFDRDAVRWMLEHGVRAPIETRANGRMRIYRRPDPNRRYLLGLDPAEGVLGDRSALSVLEYETWEQCAVYVGRDVPGAELADVGAMLGREYANERTGPAVLVPEINGLGNVVTYQLLHVQRPPYPKARLWHHLLQLKGVRTDRPGWSTTEETKHIALSDFDELLRHAASEGRAILHDRETVEDLLAIQRGRTGTIETTSHDAAMAAILAYQGRKHPVVSATHAFGAGGTPSPAAGAVRQRY